MHLINCTICIAYKVGDIAIVCDNKYNLWLFSMHVASYIYLATYKILGYENFSMNMIIVHAVT